MRIIALSTLTAFWEENSGYQDAKEPTLAWYRHALHADWSSPAEVKQDLWSGLGLDKRAPQGLGTGR